MKKIRRIIKKLSNPRVRRRLKIGLSLLGGAILFAVILKIVYDIGYFDAQSLKNAKSTEQPIARTALTLESAQHIVTNALKEDASIPKTIVDEIVNNNNNNLVPIIVENNKVKKVAWIINMRLFFVGDLFNDQGLNLTEGIERQRNDAFAR
jgi:hypothetical protein